MQRTKIIKKLILGTVVLFMIIITSFVFSGCDFSFGGSSSGGGMTRRNVEASTQSNNVQTANAVEGNSLNFFV